MFKRLLAALALISAAFAAHAQDTGAVRVDIAANGREAWTVTYRLAAPATRLAFARSPDDSRTRDWTPGEGFEIVATDEGEVLRRRDGAAFLQAEVTLLPRYRELPMDYAPFSPFGDGGMLAYTGRFFACPQVCGGDERWAVTLAADPSLNVLVNGEITRGSAAWIDAGQGTNIYVGPARPVASEAVVAVIDEALPPVIRDQLMAELPRFMDQFAARLGVLDAPPMLFASWDTSVVDGSYGRQGGTLPGQVFIHFYGSFWNEEMARGGFADGLSWHFAHEAAHLYQRQTYTTARDGYWIHEGGAEALAALALMEGRPDQAAGVEAVIANARAECAEKLAGRSIRRAISEGDTEVPYSCGMVVNLALHQALLREAPDSDGLYAVWRDYVRRTQGVETVTATHFIESVSAIGGEQLATDLAVAVADARFDPATAAF
ncbi:hypothetical protein [Brevundimonas sp.]|uniref:hypothetical protein n=1 Tax=Brevundimonas sp. TaxID=1871086 RepID=UPI0025DCA09D|nr:hypothetical protein [Brevundimonas sp.]